MKIETHRWYRNDATYSNGYVKDEGRTIFEFKILELPWRNNQRKISCIPEGDYIVHKEGPTEKRDYVYFRVHGVPGRDGILWHPGSYTRQILGCFLPGEQLIDMDKDGILDITSTKKTLRTLTDLMPDTFTLTIRKG